MSTIFEIVGIEASIKFKDKEYPIVDPKHLDKVKILDEWERHQSDVAAKKDTVLELSTRDYELKKKYVALYVPTMKEALNDLGQHTLDKLYKHVIEMANENFGAQIKKIDTEKKSGPEVQA